MLNDLARPTRLLMASMGVAVGLMTAGIVVDVGSTTLLVLLVLGLLVEVAVLVGWMSFVARADRRLRDEVVHGAAQLAGGQVRGVPAAGRVRRRRIDRRRGWQLPGAGAGPGPSLLLVVDSLTDDAARRVAALVPATFGLELRRAPVALLLHPDLPEVAMVDDRVTASDLERIRRDERWGRTRLPSDRSVVGGYPALALLAGVAVAIGLVAGLQAVA